VLLDPGADRPGIGDGVRHVEKPVGVKTSSAFDNDGGLKAVRLKQFHHVGEVLPDSSFVVPEVFVDPDCRVVRNVRVLSELFGAAEARANAVVDILHLGAIVLLKLFEDLRPVVQRVLDGVKDAAHPLVVGIFLGRTVLEKIDFNEPVGVGLSPELLDELPGFLDPAFEAGIVLAHQGPSR
jgi:hypothetical protein